MRRRVVVAAALAALIASRAWAADAPKPEADQTVKLSPVALPIVVDHRVINYIFVEVHILLTPSADAVALRDKEPYFRDALVRAAFRTPFVLANDPNHLDEAKLKATLMRDAVAVAGPGTIRAVVVDSQTPQHRFPIVRPPAAPPAPNP
jgi:hypothetical protein